MARCVAPRAGAWVETDAQPRCRRPTPVAPRAGAWVETGGAVVGTLALTSRPSRGGVG